MKTPAEQSSLHQSGCRSEIGEAPIRPKPIMGTQMIQPYAMTPVVCHSDLRERAVSPALLASPTKQASVFDELQQKRHSTEVPLPKELAKDPAQWMFWKKTKKPSTNPPEQVIEY